MAAITSVTGGYHFSVVLSYFALISTANVALILIRAWSSMRDPFADSHMRVIGARKDRAKILTLIELNLSCNSTDYAMQLAYRNSSESQVLLSQGWLILLLEEHFFAVELTHVSSLLLIDRWFVDPYGGAHSARLLEFRLAGGGTQCINASVDQIDMVETALRQVGQPFPILKTKE